MTSSLCCELFKKVQRLKMRNPRMIAYRISIPIDYSVKKLLPQNLRFDCLRMKCTSIYFFSCLSFVSLPNIDRKWQIC